MARDLTWNSPVQYLKTVGPVRAQALARLGIETVEHLLGHYPRRYFDRSSALAIGKTQAGQTVTIQGEIMTAGERRTRRGGTIQTMAVADDSGMLFCVWFNQSYLLRQFRTGKRIMCSGELQRHAGRLQLLHPDFEILDQDNDRLHTGRLVPQYPLTRGLGQHWLRRLIHNCLETVGANLPETLPAELLARRDLCSRQEGYRAIHFPENHQQRESARRRLVFEELFLLQLTMSLRRRGRRLRRGIRLGPPGDLTRRLVESLPFQLTSAQRRVLSEILNDLRSGTVMHRLLQGDVGSGKTLVALIAALFLVEQGYQALIMAPTEVLARQHGRTIDAPVGSLGLSLATLTGATRSTERRAILTGLGKGEIDLLIGTHAVFHDEVQFKNLGLAVVDEQHRFGVLQRGRVSQSEASDQSAHLLVMSATPIPRSLSLTLYGDLDLSIIDEMPQGRLPVVTHLADAEDEETVLGAVEKKLAAGQQGYIIYPVIEETEKQDLKAATVEYERLASGFFSHRRLALLHGRLRPREKEAIMTDFATGVYDLLVATTVIEVGVDVANANSLVINHPERFGLAQLHQLRGRIGRGTAEAHCYLLLDRWSAPEARERIRFFSRHHDGFELAEEDLRRRGPGDIWGVRQHGLPGFRLANPLQDAELVKLCALDAEELLAADPQLGSPAGKLLRQTLESSYGRLLSLRTTG
ncbi:MAG: ATP-dependent DNA helicase RecG [bacterium]